VPFLVQQDTSTCLVPFCLWIHDHLCSSFGTNTAHTQRMFFKQDCLLSCMPSKKALLPRLFLRCLLLVFCWGQLHVHFMIIFWNHAYTQVRPSWCLSRDAFPAALLSRRASLLAYICTRKMVPLFVVQDTMAFLSLESSVCIFWNRFCTYTGSACLLSCISTRNMLRYLLFRTGGPACILSMRFICNQLTEQRDRFPSLLLLCISWRSCYLVCCSKLVLCL
jgi:hypothetical protein